MTAASKLLAEARAVEADTAVAGPDGFEDRNAPSYARELRVVGQLLEYRDVATADLVVVAGTYIIKGEDESRASKQFVTFSLERVEKIIWVFSCGGFWKGGLITRNRYASLQS